MNGANAVMRALNHHQHKATSILMGKGKHTGAKTCDRAIEFTPFSISFWPRSNKSSLPSAIFWKPVGLLWSSRTYAQVLGVKMLKEMGLRTMVPAPLSHISFTTLFRCQGVRNVDRKKAEIASVPLPS